MARPALAGGPDDVQPPRAAGEATSLRIGRSSLFCRCFLPRMYYLAIERSPVTRFLSTAATRRRANAVDTRGGRYSVTGTTLSGDLGSARQAAEVCYFAVLAFGSSVAAAFFAACPAVRTGAMRC